MRGEIQAKLAHTPFRHKLIEDNRKTIIPRLLETVFHCVVREELWSALKRQKFPVVDFKRLRSCCIAEVKRNVPELF